MIPGPRAAVSRPRRKITARSYSRTTLRPLASSTPAITATVAKGPSIMREPYHMPDWRRNVAADGGVPIPSPGPDETVDFRAGVGAIRESPDARRRRDAPFGQFP